MENLCESVLLRLQDKAGEAQGAAKDTYNQAGSKASELGSKAQVRASAVRLELFCVVMVFLNCVMCKGFKN